MTPLAEILQALVAILLIVGDVILHIMRVPADGFDSAVSVIVAVYIGGKVVQTVQGKDATLAALPGVANPPAAVAQAPNVPDTAPLPSDTTAAAAGESLPSVNSGA